MKKKSIAMKQGKDDGWFYFQGKRYGYTSRSHYQCEFCEQPSRATWNAITRENRHFTFVCDNHFLSHCITDKAARFIDPRPDEEYKLITIGEVLQGYMELKAIYAK